MKKEKEIIVKFEICILTFIQFATLIAYTSLKRGIRRFRWTKRKNAREKKRERERKIVGRFWDILFFDITPYKE